MEGGEGWQEQISFFQRYCMKLLCNVICDVERFETYPKNSLMWSMEIHVERPSWDFRSQKTWIKCRDYALFEWIWVVSRRIKHNLYKDNSLKSMMSMICIMHGYNHVDLIPMMIWRGLYDFNTCRPHLERFLLRSAWRSSNFVTDVFQLWNALTFGWLVGVLLRWERHQFYTFINYQRGRGGWSNPMVTLIEISSGVISCLF